MLPLLFFGGAGYLLWQWLQNQNPSAVSPQPSSPDAPQNYSYSLHPAAAAALQQTPQQSYHTPPTPLPAPQQTQGGSFASTFASMFQNASTGPRGPLNAIPPPPTTPAPAPIAESNMFGNPYAYSYLGGSQYQPPAPPVAPPVTGGMTPQQAAAEAAAIAAQQQLPPDTPTGIPGYAKYLGPGQYAYSKTPKEGYYPAIIPPGSV